VSGVTTPGSDRDWEDVDDVSWTLLDLEELVDAYWAVVAPMMETDELDPKREKTDTQLAPDHGFRPLLYALRGSTTTGPSQSFGVRISGPRP